MVVSLKSDSQVDYIKDRRGCIYKMTKYGLIKVSVEEGIRIESNLNKSTNDVPYIDILKATKNRAKMDGRGKLE